MNLAEATSIIHSALPQAIDPGQAPEGAMTALHQIAGDAEVSSFLRATRDDTTVPFHATRSYRHPLGFDTLLLIEAPPRFRLRMHAWWPYNEPTVEHVHNHRFAVATKIILGHYEMKTYQIGPEGSPMSEYRERSSPEEETWSMDHIGVANLRVSASTHIGKGSGYALAADVLHQVWVPQGTMCVTLFLTVPAILDQPRYTRVFAPEGTWAPEPSQKHVMLVGDYQDRLEAIAAELA